MKQYLLGIVMFIVIGVFAQAPEKMTYQAVIRDNLGQLIVNQGVGMQISILQTNAIGSTVYTEKQSPISNSNGLISIIIGGDNATIISGNFSNIDWANNTYFIKTETDPTTLGGINYTITGTSQLLSVPYALNSKMTESIEDKIIVGEGIIRTGSGTDNDPYILSIDRDEVFQLPTANAQDATDIESSSATLNGLVNAKGFNTTVAIQWGETTAYGNNISLDNVFGSDDNLVSTPLSGLEFSTAYHYRLLSANAIGIIYSNDISFTTSPQEILGLTIYEIQTSIHNGDNIIGSPVTTSGIVTAVGNNNFVIQNGTGPWNGIYIYDSNLAETPNVGDAITITGTINEYFNLTQIIDITSYTLNSSGNTLPSPVIINTGEPELEPYESVLVKVENISIIDDLGMGEYEIEDVNGGLPLRIDDKYYDYTPLNIGDSFISITGIMNYSNDNFKLCPQNAGDMIE